MQNDPFVQFKAAQREGWALFVPLEAYTTPAAAALVEFARAQRGDKVLDVGCGTGVVAVTAARRGAQVKALDLSPVLIERARWNADTAGVAIEFTEGDAEALPYPDASFDIVLSQYGHMFAPRPELAAKELIRVCRAGGRIVMANWVPTGFIGQMFKATAARVPPPAGMPSPVLWGDEATVRGRIRDGIATLTLTHRNFIFEFPFPPAEVVEFWRQYYGPTQKAFAALDADGQTGLRQDLIELWSRHNRATDGTTRVESEYLEVTAIRA